MGTMLVSSCSVNDDIEESGNGKVLFTAGIEQLATPDGSPGTKAAGTTWTAGDAIGIYMVDNGATTVVMNTENKQYTTPAGDGNFTPITGSEIYYPQTGKVDFISYYPWKASGTGGIENNLYPINVAVQSSPESIDLLWAKADNSGAGYDKNNGGAVALPFRHQLSKIVLLTKADPSINPAKLDGMTVTITGMNTTGTFNVLTGAFGAPATPADITPQTVTDGGQYEAIILPRKVAAQGDVTVEFALSNNETFVWKPEAGKEFESGKIHEWTITLTRTGVTATGTIKPWDTTGTGGTGEAE